MYTTHTPHSERTCAKDLYGAAPTIFIVVQVACVLIGFVAAVAGQFECAMCVCVCVCSVCDTYSAYACVNTQALWVFERFPRCPASSAAISRYARARVSVCVCAQEGESHVCMRVICCSVHRHRLWLLFWDIHYGLLHSDAYESVRGVCVRVYGCVHHLVHTCASPSLCV
jgi:hypothetical protein